MAWDGVERRSSAQQRQCTRVVLPRGAWFQLHCQTHNAYGELRERFEAAHCDVCPIMQARGESDRNWLAGTATARFSLSHDEQRIGPGAAVLPESRRRRTGERVREGCLSDQTLAAWIDRMLLSDQDRRVVAHFEQCAFCRELAMEACTVADRLLERMS